MWNLLKMIRSQLKIPLQVLCEERRYKVKKSPSVQKQLGKHRRKRSTGKPRRKKQHITLQQNSDDYPLTHSLNDAIKIPNAINDSQGVLNSNAVNVSYLSNNTQVSNKSALPLIQFQTGNLSVSSALDAATETRKGTPRIRNELGRYDVSSPPQAGQSNDQLESRAAFSVCGVSSEPPCLERVSVYELGEGDVCLIPASSSARTSPHIEVPSWRLNAVRWSYTLEGTENLEDEIFIKRHQKFEVEERRHKRWDRQKQRDVVRRMRQDQSHSKRKLLQSLYPDMGQVKEIELSGDVGPALFGYPLPEQEQRDFDLP